MMYYSLLLLLLPSLVSLAFVALPFQTLTICLERIHKHSEEDATMAQ
jgi:hypothetical protein